MRQPARQSQIKFNPNKVTLDIFPVKSNFTNEMLESFGKWLQQKRKAAGLNQTELAALSRITKATISLYENDKVKQPRFTQLDKISKALGLPEDAARIAFNERNTGVDAGEVFIINGIGQITFDKRLAKTDVDRLKIVTTAAFETAKAMIDAEKDE